MRSRYKHVITWMRTHMLYRQSESGRATSDECSRQGAKVSYIDREKHAVSLIDNVTSDFR